MELEKFKKIVDSSNNVVFFGGAGVSTESGLPDFRSQSTGLYNQVDQPYSPEEILSHDFFINHTEAFYKFYRDNLVKLSVKPNITHYKLVELEKKGKLKAIITQNIDGLHSLAGSKKVIELHGSIYRNYCINCHKFYPVDKITKKNIPRCDECKGVIKPDVVLYQESLKIDLIEKAIKFISQADTLIIGGTSLKVYPAAGLVSYFRGSNLILINREATDFDSQANLIIHDSIGKVFSQI